MKILKYIAFVLGVCFLFSGEYLGKYAAYSKIVGIAILMFTLYTISSKLDSKKRENRDSDNLRL